MKKLYRNLFPALFLLFVASSMLTAQTVEYADVDDYLATPPECFVKEMPVLVIIYLPTEDSIHLNDSITGITTTLDDIKQHILESSVQLKFMLEESSKFHGYKDTAADPYLGYRVVDYIYVYENFHTGKEVPWNPGIYRPDYNEIMTRFNGKYYVDTLGVKEVWLWGWHHGLIEPAESNMSSPLTGDISNSERYPDDLPVYNNTYILYNYNYGRTAAEAMHNHGHQIEAQLIHANIQQDQNDLLFREKFVGWNGNDPPIGRCGDTHHPPNTTADYDYYNETWVNSDIENWKPHGGPTKLVSKFTWEGIDYTWPNDNPPVQQVECHWYIYWIQNMPGNGNAVEYGSNYMTNWHKFNADWEGAISDSIGLYSNSPSGFEPCATTTITTLNPLEKETFIFPNPSTSTIQINLPVDTPIEIEIFNQSGELVYSKSDQAPIISVNLNSLPRGMYFLRITTPDGKVITHRISKY